MMTPMLKTYQLLGYVDGSIPAPPETISIIEEDFTKVVPNPDY